MFGKKVTRQQTKNKKPKSENKSNLWTNNTPKNTRFAGKQCCFHNLKARHHTQPKQQKQNNQQWKQLRFGKIILGKLVWRKEAKLKKGNGETRKKDQQTCFLKRVRWRKRKRQLWNFEREDQRKKEEEDKQEEGFWRKGFLGNQRENIPKIAGKYHFLASFQNKDKPKTQKPEPNNKKKKEGLKHLFACWNTTHFFGYFCFSQLTPYSFGENTIKIVFSAEHSVCGSQSLKPF